MDKYILIGHKEMSHLLGKDFELSLSVLSSVDPEKKNTVQRQRKLPKKTEFLPDPHRVYISYLLTVFCLSFHNAAICRQVPFWLTGCVRLTAGSV